MKKIVCELCESMEFVKDGGMFICQSCGTKYTLEEAKRMMKEVDGEVSVSAAQAPSADSNKQQIENFLVLAANAFQSCNNKETESYCNKIIELDVTNYKAWFLKGQAIAWQSTYEKTRVSEGANAMRKAYDYAPEEEKKEFAKKSLDAIKNVCNGLAELAKSKYEILPEEVDRLKFVEFLKTCYDATESFEGISKEISEYATAVLKEHRRFSAKQMNLAGVGAMRTVRAKWRAISYPNKASWDTYMIWFIEIHTILELSVDWGKKENEEVNELIKRYEDYIVAVREPISAKSYRQEWNSWTNSFEWVTDYSLTPASIENRERLIKNAKKEIENLKRKSREADIAKKKAAEQAKRDAANAYWAEHKEEKNKLLTEQGNLMSKRAKIKNEIDSLQKQIVELMAAVEDVSFKAEIDKLLEQDAELRTKRASLGIFAGKEKKQIAQEIVDVEAAINELKEKEKEAKKAKSEEAKAKVEPLKVKQNELNKELDAVNRKISNIEAKLRSVPGK
ncbi:MAG: hypothetical protein IKY78_03735 [Clostridia bacterium]|nr:hypothetical protein [Clostridia bacterium]